MSVLQSPLFFDLFFCIAIIIYIIDEARLGLLISFLNFISIVIGYITSLLLYATLAIYLSDLFGLSVSFSNALSFVLLSIIISFSIRLLLLYAQKLYKNIVVPQYIYHSGGAFFGIFAFFFLSLILVNLFLLFPLSSPLRNIIINSISGKLLLNYSFIVEEDIKGIFGQAITDSLHFLTVKPKSDEFVRLPFKVQNAPVDKTSEQSMLTLVNLERKNTALQSLAWDEPLAKASRQHGQDMGKRGYFSHTTPEGLSPFDRLDRQSIFYQAAGENLALAPTTEIAMQGLMRSLGHRENILSDKFTKVGIGVVDLGIYGKIYVQTFSD